MPVLPRIMDEAEVARLLQVTPRTLQRWREDGRLACHKLGKKALYTEDDLAEALRSCRVARSGSAA